MRIILFVIMIMPFNVFAQTGFWSQTNQFSGRFDAIIVNDSGFIFAGGEGRGIVYRSKNFGLSWTQIALPQAFAVLCFEVSSERRLFAGTDVGIFTSSNNGDTWQNIGLNTFNVSAILFSNGTLFAGTKTKGIFRLSVTGKWEQVGPVNLNISSINIHPGGYLFATAYNGGIYRSDLTGVNWNIVGFPSATVRDLTIDKNGVIYVCTMISYGGSAGVFRSTDIGNTWENYWFTSQYNSYYDPNGGIISNSMNYIFLGTTNGVYMSTGSLLWKNISDRVDDYIYSFALGSDTILYAGGYSRGVFRGGGPANFGNSDISKLYDLFPIAKGNKYKYNYQFSDTTYYLGFLNHIQRVSGTIEYYVVDSSYKENKIEWSIEQRMDLQLNYIAPEGNTQNKIQKTNNFVLTESLDGYHELMAAPTTWDPGRFYNDKGNWDFPVYEYYQVVIPIYRYHDEPEFSICNNYHSFLDSLWFDDRGLYKRTYYYHYGGNSQIYTHTHIYLDSVTVEVNNQILHLPNEFYLSQNYPNPFNPNTTITYSIPKQSNVDIKVFDLLGREVTTLVNEEKSAGNYKVVLKGSNLSSGVYLYRLHAGNFVSTKKFVLIK